MSTNITDSSTRNFVQDGEPTSLVLDKGVLRAEVQQLADHAASLKASFQSIERRLRKTQRLKDISPTLVEAINELINGWVEIKKNFVEKIWHSRDLAGEAAEISKDLVRFLAILIKTEDAEEMKMEIEEYSKTVEDSREKCKHLINDFSDIVFSIQGFHEDWREVIHEHREHLKLSPTVNMIDQEISVIHATIQSFQRVLLDFNRDNNILGFARHAISFMSGMCPLWWSSNAVKIASNSGIMGLLQRQKENARQLRELQANRKADAADLGALSVLDDDLRKSNEDFKDLAMRIGKISEIWGAIQGDLHSALNTLKLARQPTDLKVSFNREMFNARIETASNIYQVVADILLEYQGAVNISAATFQGIM